MNVFSEFYLIFKQAARLDLALSETFLGLL